MDDYPYGFRLRCKIRYWLEHKTGKGFRMVSQTSNPKRPGLIWNAPKKSTYCRFGGAMFLDDDGHVHWAGLTEYSDGAEARAWSDKYRAAVPEAGLAALDLWVAAKVAHDAARGADPLRIGLAAERVNP